MKHEVIIIDDNDYDPDDELAPEYDVYALIKAAREAASIRALDANRIGYRSRLRKLRASVSNRSPTTNYFNLKESFKWQPHKMLN
ncbi:MAG: hypothetical protein ABIU20_03020 [Blastocatellia bacterium]